MHKVDPVPADPKARTSDFLRYRLVLVVTLLLAPFLRAQNYDFIEYSVENGLSQSEVTSLFQDSRGYLWVGTAGGGVCLFDGVNFTEYNESNGLSGAIVQAIAEDAKGNIWVGTTWGGASRFDGKNFVTYGKKQGLPSSAISALTVSGKDLWIGTDYGAAIYDANTEKLTLASSMKYSISALHTDRSGQVWAGSEGSVFRMSGQTPVRIPLPVSEHKRTINYITDDGKGLLYICASDGLFAWHLSSGTLTDNIITKDMAGKNISCALFNSEGESWVSVKETGLIEFDATGKKIDFNSARGLSSREVNALLEDNTHHIWIGTRQEGLVKLRSESFNYFNNVEGLQRNDVYSVAEDKDGKLWVGTGEGGVYVYDGTVSKKINSELQGNTCIFHDSKGRTWVGHKNGLALMNGYSVSKSYLNGTRVRWITEDHLGNLWLGTWEKGLYKFDGTDFKNYTVKDGLPMDYVHAVKEDSKGNIWIGTGAGLTRFSPTREASGASAFTTYAKELCNTYVGTILEDKRGLIWFNTDKCIMSFDGTTFKSYNQSDGLRSNTVYLMIFDNDDNLWVGTNKGVDKIVLDAKGRFVSVKNFGPAEGFRGIECNARAVGKDKAGHIWFGTVRGLMRYNASNDQVDKVEPRVHITDIRLFLEPTNWLWKGVREEGWFHLPEKLELPYDQNHLTFYFTGIHLKSPQNVRYQFMLQGFDSTWSPSVQKNDFTYPNLPPGTYRFMVKAENSDGIWSQHPAVSCPIVILPPALPFWQATWFWMIIGCLVIGLIYYFIALRTRIIRRQKEVLEEQVRQRTQEITRQNEEKTVMLKEIHHRVKNNLQIISSLINLQSESIEDPKVLALFDECRHRINSMALIHEKMYQSKNLVNINIREYITELVRSLIDVYDLDKKITLRIDVEEHAFSIDTIVPLGLILSETISNSLKYAFNGRQEGTIYVSLRKTSGFEYEFVIGDNGVGMAKDIDLANAKTLGLQLIRLLADQVDGRIVREPADGTRWVLLFKG